jgi:S1-C subfamily serine protease
MTFTPPQPPFGHSTVDPASSPPTSPHEPTPPAPPSGRTSGSRSFAALAAAALLGGGAALGGAVATGVLEGETTIVTRTVAAQVPASAVPGRDLSIQQIYERSAPAVVQITSSIGGGSGFGGGGQALGSGFVIDKDGHIVTNFHVVDGATSIEVSFSNQDTLDAVLVGVDPSTDLAVLKVDAGARALTVLPLADSDEVTVGDAVVAIGNPFGLERTVTAGIVSALQRNVTAPNGATIDHVIQTDAPINSGNSGGPLFDAVGEVIGVNSQIQTAGGSGNVGIGFAVPSNTVEYVVSQIIASGQVDRAFLGVGAREIDSELARTFELPVDSGLLVETVAPDSGAARAGLEGGDTPVVVAGVSYTTGGDVIVAAGGKRVTTVAELRDVLADHAPGATIELQIYRGDDEKTVTVTLGRQPEPPTG